jgi:hypothetical protein
MESTSDRPGGHNLLFPGAGPGTSPIRRTAPVLAIALKWQLRAGLGQLGKLTSKTQSRQNENIKYSLAGVSPESSVPNEQPLWIHRHGILSRWLGPDAGNEPRDLPERRQFALRARMRLRLAAPRRTSFQYLAALLLSARVSGSECGTRKSSAQEGSHGAAPEKMGKLLFFGCVPGTTWVNIEEFRVYSFLLLCYHSCFRASPAGCEAPRLSSILDDNMGLSE